MIPLEEARSHVLGEVAVLAPAERRRADALGCVLADDVTSPEAVPPFDNTAVDGLAVRAADTADPPTVLRVAGLIAAGDPGDVPVEPGAGVRIMTGAPIPPGADAVVMVEDTEPVEGGRVRVGVAVAPGDGIRRAGSDVAVGDLVLRRGTELRAAHLGVLASIGVAAVRVHPPARVGVLSTGDELVEDGSPLRHGQVREANKDMLLALVAGAGAVPVDLGTAADEEEALRAALTRGVESCDAILTSGGVSMGEFDLVKDVLDRMGRMRWMQIAIRPAKPFAFGVLAAGGRSVPCFGLPGNPVSSMVSFELLARPALRRMMGHERLDRRRVRGLADVALARRRDGKTHWLRVVTSFGEDGRCHVRPTGAQGSHQLAASAAADGLAEVPDGDGVPAGGEVDVLLL